MIKGMFLKIKWSKKQFKNLKWSQMPNYNGAIDEM